MALETGRLQPGDYMVVMVQTSNGWHNEIEPNLVKASANVRDANDERLLEITEGLEDSRAIEIQQQSNEEFALLVKEFDAAVGR